MCNPGPQRKVAAPARVERDSLAAWHCSACSQPGRGNSLGWALPGTASWIRKCLEVNSLPPSQPGWWLCPLWLLDESVSQLSSGNCHDFIPLNTEIASHFWAQICFAIIRLSYRAKHH